MEAASCEVAALAHSPNFPVMNKIVAPFLSSRYYDRWASWYRCLLTFLGDHPLSLRFLIWVHDTTKTRIPELTHPFQVHLSRLLQDQVQSEEVIVSHQLLWPDVCTMYKRCNQLLNSHVCFHVQPVNPFLISLLCFVICQLFKSINEWCLFIKFSARFLCCNIFSLTVINTDGLRLTAKLN